MKFVRLKSNNKNVVTSILISITLPFKTLFLLAFLVASSSLVNALDLERKADSTALFTLYINAGGSGWINNSGWLTSYITSWHGVSTGTVNGHVRVTGLSLPNNNLTGTLILNGLTELQVLDVHGNPLPGGSSDYSQNLKLKFIDGSNTGMGITYDIGNLTLLESLNLNGNGITQVGGGGSALPPGLFTLTNLTFLQLGSNKFTGSIPSTIGSLVNLTFLDLGNNLLTGAIPITIGNLTKLQYLYLGVNQLSGSIPTQIGNLSPLKYLWLAGNQLTGSIPDQIGNLTSLTSVWLGGNQLNGNIPSTIGNLINLEDLHLDNNQLTGSIPTQMSSLTKLTHLFLNSNQLTGSIPSFLGSITTLQFIDVGANQLTGIVPVELNNLVNLKFLSICTNQLTGGLPVNFLANATQLETLYLCNNFGLTGAVPLSCLSSPALTYANLVSTSFDGLPNISTRPIFSNPNANNKVFVMTCLFTFEDIEPNRNIAASKFFYVPQNEITASPVTILAQQPLSLSFTVGGSANSYQWQKNGVNIPGANSNTYSKTALLSDGGNYTLVVTNSLVPSLTIKRNISVTVLPSNDYCSSATSIAIPSITSDTTTPATSDAAPNCGNAADGAGGGLWYTAVGNGKTLTAILCNGSNFDTQLRIFSGSCGSLVCEAGNDDSCGTASKVSWNSIDGTSYFILVHGYGTETGAFQLELTDKLDQNIVFKSLPPRLTSDPPFQLEAFSSKGLPISYTSSNTSVATINGNVLTITGAGTSSMIATQPGDANIHSASNVVQTLTVMPSFPPLAYRTQWGKPAGLSFNGSYGIDLDAAGATAYIADGSQVVVMNSSGTILRTFGTYGSGYNQFGTAMDIKVDASGNIYVLDFGNSRVQIFDNAGNYLKGFGSFGAADGQFRNPRGLALDASGSIYIADTGNNRIQVFNSNGTLLRKFGVFGSANGQLKSPRAIALDGSGNIFVIDGNNYRVQVFDSNGNFLRTFGSQGTGNGQFGFGSSGKIIVDGSGNIFVVDGYNNRVQKFDTNGTFLLTFGTLGTASGQFNFPTGIELDPSGNILVADYVNKRIQVFSSSGSPLVSYSNPALQNNELNFPNGVAVDASSNVYVGDAEDKIKVFDKNGGYIRQFGSSGSGTGQFSFPSRVVLDNTGNIYVLDQNNSRVQVFSNSGIFIRSFGSSGSADGQLDYPYDLAVDASGNTYVANYNNDRIEVFDATGNFLRNFGSTGSGDGQFSSPTGVALDGAGNIYIVDSNNRVQIFSNAGTFIRKFGSAGIGASQFLSPNDITLDPSDRIYVSDAINQNIQVFANDGTYLFTTGSYGKENAQFNYPAQVAIDPSGLNLFVADASNNRIQAFGVADINVKINNTGITNSGTYGFGNVNMLTNSGAINAIIENLGSVPLNLNGTPKISVIGTNSSDFVVNTTSTLASVNGAGSTSFEVTFTPSASGLRTAQLSIANSDPDENPYTINLTATGVKLNQTITFGTLTSKLTSDPAFTLGATSSSGLVVTYLSSNTSVATVSGNTVTLVGVGTTNITASQSGDVNYNAATDVTQSLTVSKGNQTITFSALTPVTVSDGTFNLSATASSGLPISYSSNNSAVATLLGSVVTIVGAGTTTITASQSGDANYNAAPDVTQTLTVSKASQTITFTLSTPKVAIDLPFDLTAIASSALPVSYASSNSAVATISGKTVTLVGAGSTTITASQAGDANYDAAVDVAQTLTVTKATQSITFNALPTKTFGDSPFPLSATSSSGLVIQYATTSDKISISGNQVTLLKAGSATISAQQPGDTKYDAATTVDQTFCINPAKPVVTSTGVDTDAPVLTSSSDAGNQWFWNNVPINGATNKTYTVKEAGVYKVNVTVDNCSSVYSSDEAFVVTGDLSSQKTDIVVYPNPVEDHLKIHGLSDPLGASQLFDATGRASNLILEREENVHQANVQHLSAGIYLLRVQENNTLHQIKFVKK